MERKKIFFPLLHYSLSSYYDIYGENIVTVVFGFVAGLCEKVSAACLQSFILFLLLIKKKKKIEFV